MASREEVKFEIKESIIKELHGLCDDIMSARTEYSPKPIDMANRVISANCLNAATIKSILNEISGGC